MRDAAFSTEERHTNVYGKFGTSEYWLNGEVKSSAEMARSRLSVVGKDLNGEMREMAAHRSGQSYDSSYWK